MGIKEIRRLDIKADKQLLKLRSIQAELCIAISEIVDCPYEPYVDVFASDGHCFCFDVGGVTAPYTIPIP